VPEHKPTLADAFTALGTKSGVIEITDNGRYQLSDLHLTLAPGQRIELRAADQRRPLVELVTSCIIRGAPDAELMVNGLLVIGTAIRLENPVPGRVLFRHCSLVEPAHDACVLVNGAPAATGNLVFEHCIIGSLRLPANGCQLTVCDSIIDAGSDTAYALAASAAGGAGPPGILHAVTVLGQLHVKSMTLASEVICTGTVTVEERGHGCVRFSALPDVSVTPPQYECIRTQAGEMARWFTSRQYGQPAYCQLAPLCPPVVRTGASDSAEMGAFHSLMQPQREANLRTVLDEYLRFNMEAGIRYES